MIPVSVVIPTIGRRDYLEIAIRSLLNQSDPFAEVVVFDNSPDQNLSHHSAFGGDSRVRWERSGGQLGALESWNSAVRQCGNDHVTIFGDDDVALPAFHTQIQGVLQRSDFGLLPFTCIDERGLSLGLASGLNEDTTPRQLRYLRIEGKVNLVVPGVVFRRSKFLGIGGFQDVGLPNYLYPDELLWLKLSALETMVAVAGEPSWQYRKHPQSLGNLQSFRGFRGRVRPYVRLLQDSLVGLGVPEVEVFPPDFDCSRYVNQIQTSWFKSVFIRTVKSGSLNPATYLREIWYYLSSESTLRGKAGGLLDLSCHLVWHGVRRALPSPAKGA